MAQIATTPGAVPAPVANRPTVSRGRDAIGLILQNKVGTAGFVIFFFFVLLAIFGPMLTSGDTTTNLAQVYKPPSARHIFGTDYEGRDVFVQIVRGGRSIMIVGALAAFLSTAFAVTFGALSAFVGGALDSIMLVITDVVLTIPYIILLGVLAAFIKLNSPVLLAFIIASVAWPTLYRAVRAQVLSLKEREYIEAARMLDLGTPYIIFREVIPNMMSYIAINFVIAMTSAIYGQIILYFLGLVPLSGDNWGLMINLAYTRGALFFRDSIWYILAPIAAISLLQLSLVMISRALEDIFNPRLREG
jgi:peptide/nickel transport system permease protein